MTFTLQLCFLLVSDQLSAADLTINKQPNQILSRIYLISGVHVSALTAFLALSTSNNPLYAHQSSQKKPPLKSQVHFIHLQNQLLRLKKENAFQQAVWVSALVLMMVITAAGLAFYAHRQNMTRQISLEALRVRIASDLHDELGSSLTRISLLSDLVRSGAQPNTQSQQLNNISAISREAITSMSDVIWSIDARNENLGALVERMTDCCSALLVEQDINVDFDKIALPLANVLPLDIRQDLYLIFKEAINNCAKHASATEVKIQLSWTKNLLSLLIADNGCGLLADRKLTGQGFANMHMRARRLAAQLSIYDNNGLTLRLTGIKLI